MAKKPYYVQNTEKKTVTVDFNIKPTTQEEHALNLLLAAGYELKTKSEARSARALEMAESVSVKSKKDLDLSKLTEEDAKKVEKVLHGKGKGKGFFAARSLYSKILEAKGNDK